MKMNKLVFASAVGAVLVSYGNVYLYECEKFKEKGVWKAELIITPPAGEAYRETRILDLRKYSGQGLIIFVM